MSIFESYDFAQNIKEKASDILSSMTDKVRRSKNRKRYIFYALYNAYREYGYVVDQHEIARKIKMDYKEISKAKSLVPDRGRDYSNSQISIKTMKECLPSYYNQFFLDNTMYTSLEEIVNTIAELYPYLNMNQPHRHVAILCCIYAEYHGCVIDKYELASMLHMDYGTFLKTYKLLHEIYYST